MEFLEARELLVSDWQNPLWAYDVDEDSTLSPLDVLVVINTINQANPNLDFRNPVGMNPYLDVDGDVSLSPLDVLVLINRINQAPGNVSISSTLLVDTGASVTDRITNSPIVVGQFDAKSGLTYTAKARLDRGPVFDMPIGNGNQLNFDPRTNGIVPDGGHAAKLLVMASDGTVGSSIISYSLDTTPPALSAWGLVAVDDTGARNDDGITRIADPRIQLSGTVGDRYSIKIDDAILFDGALPGSIVRQTGGLNDGVHAISISGSDLAGNTVAATSSLTVDTLPPTGVSLRIAAADALDAAGTRTAASKVLLTGAVEPLVDVVVNNNPTLVGPTGSFQIPSVPLTLGANLFGLQAKDLAGNQVETTVSLSREDQTQTDTVISWNAVALRAIQQDVTDPPVATRNLAMVSIAQYDTLAAISGTPAFLIKHISSGAYSAQAAAAAAAWRVLTPV
jgi:hypothetical protein